jgi:hypothetical protein
MYTDTKQSIINPVDNAIMSLMAEQDSHNHQAFSGMIRDIITHHDTGQVEDTGWSHNTIVNSIDNLIACLLKSEAGYTGISYWAIGSGSDSWDDVNPPSPSQSDVALVNEIGRLAIPSGAITYLDDNGNITATKTNKLQIDLTFGQNDCNGKWREFGIVGGNATISANSGIFINHKTHGLIVKTSTMSIERIMRFTFLSTTQA